MKTTHPFTLFAVALLISSLSPRPVMADKVCIKPGLKNGKVTLSRKVVTGNSCARGYTEVSSTSIPAAYGNGAAGAFPGTVGLNGQFQSINITDLTVPSGVTLRSTGDCVISGRLLVNAAAVSGAPNSTNSPASAASAGISLGAAGNGKSFATGEGGILYGGAGGLGLNSVSSDTAQFSAPILAGGGGGGSEHANDSGVVRSGGGGIRLLCYGTIRITSTGSIEANGTDGSVANGGGGGGGVVILMSKRGIVNEGTIKVRGGNGQSAADQYAASGGGGGGLVRFVAPAITAGTVDFAGGTGGAAQNIVDPHTIYFSGAGGGATIGDGGSGGSVTDDVSRSTTAGANGFQRKARSDHHFVS